ncbi:MAG: sigma-54-dependent transcriptional regulator [Acidiferrobacterales bacterium]
MNGERILVVDDEPDIRRLVQEVLEDEGYQVSTAEDAASARAALQSERPQLILLDIWMPGTDGIALLKEWSVSGRPDVPVVMMSGHGNVETAVEATRLGAYDFIEKPVSLAKLLVTVSRALQAEALRLENLRLRSGVQITSELVGSSRLMQGLRDDIARIAATDTWVLITGEPGSGKAVAARYLHRCSYRRDQPFVEVSLGAIPSENIPLKLFGSEEGPNVSPGSFEQASGGTLLLDEVGDLDLSTQAQLLNALAEGRFLRLGGKKTVAMDVRILAATNQNLTAAVSDGRFREDLYYRLNVVPLNVPPLREHSEDVGELVKFYLDWFAKNDHLVRRNISEDAIATLSHSHWPGNVRELKNLVQRLLIMKSDPEISAAEIDQSLGYLPDDTKIELPQSLFNRELRDARDSFERLYLQHNLEQTQGNVSALAEIAGMERTHLYRKMKLLGVNPKHGKKK